MGQFVDIRQFQGNYPTLDPRWFFRNARRSRRTDGGYEFSAELDFPIALHLHCDLFERGEHGGLLRVSIRRWIETNITTTVLATDDDRNYIIVHTPPGGSYFDRRHEHVRHGYVVLRFETEADAVLFALAHSDLITRQPSKFHPNHPPPEGAEVQRG